MVKTLKNFNFKTKRVLVRCDFNVPLDEAGKVLDVFRIEKTLPTIEYLIKKGATLLLMSHLGRPLEEKKLKIRKQKYSLEPIAKNLEKLLKRKVVFLPDCIGEKIEEEIKKMKEGDTVLLENLRFYKEEEENDENFAKKLAKLGDLYINDAFSASHRAHASIVGIAKYLPSAAGLLLEREIKVLSKVLENPWHPLVVIIGGVKISTKIKVIEQFLKKADHLLLGGEIANVILIGKRITLGRPFLEEKEVREKIEKIDLTNPKLHLPVDGIISLQKPSEDYLRVGAIGSVRKEEKVFDIGPETIKVFSEIIKQAKMILWSGPLGLYEEKKFETGTKEIAENIVRNYSGFKVAGGGDTISAINQFGLLDKFDHVSTGGGAMLEFLAGERLPGIEALRSAN